MRLSNSIYVYVIDPETEIIDNDICLDRSKENTQKAKDRVNELEAEGKEAFYTIGVLTKCQTLN